MEVSEEEGWKVPTIRGVLVVDSKTGGGEDKSKLERSNGGRTRVVR